ncbi:hypothetical protein NDU88_000512 [Pleurodeles waltl]|uniref:Uncharacterized protein n=1 Tax=Pleurodeles waltl TaxID=8319 RepID=A0AAV7MKQ5_PLEWA|nr:hypothetical protein NDU88_000512 [Pleurodeles waltl]
MLVLSGPGPSVQGQGLGAGEGLVYLQPFRGRIHSSLDYTGSSPFSRADRGPPTPEEDAAPPGVMCSRYLRLGHVDAAGTQGTGWRGAWYPGKETLLVVQVSIRARVMYTHVVPSVPREGAAEVLGASRTEMQVLPGLGTTCISVPEDGMEMQVLTRTPG